MTAPAKQAKKAPKMSVSGETLNLDPSDFTLGELEEFEEITGRELTELVSTAATKTPKPKDLIALVFLIKRRDNPDFTLDDARRVRISELEIRNP